MKCSDSNNPFSYKFVHYPWYKVSQLDPVLRLGENVPDVVGLQDVGGDAGVHIVGLKVD